MSYNNIEYNFSFLDKISELDINFRKLLEKQKKKRGNAKNDK